MAASVFQSQLILNSRQGLLISLSFNCNTIFYYKLKSENSEEIFLSEYAVNDRFVTEAKYCEQPKNPVYVGNWHFSRCSDRF